MAAAEARAVWQRAANRCFVQEDAKRAPKLACCQSSCATSKAVDAGPASAADESDHAAINGAPFNRKSFSNPSSDPKWWLHSQPTYEYQRGITYEQLKALEDEVETLKASNENKTYKVGVSQFSNEDCDSSCHTNYKFQADTMKKSANDSQALPELMHTIGKQETSHIDPVGCSVSKQTNEFLDPDYSWIEGEQAGPWWRITDKDELASLVSQKSLNLVENCDLPPPQKKYLRRHPCANIGNDKLRTTSLEWEAKSCGFSNLTAHAHASLDSGLVNRKHRPSANEGLLYYAYAKSSSYNTNHEDVTDKLQAFDGDPSKAELMEALCHSQTRAREAEELAKQAYAEKEHVVKLLFKQASQLFAYKQWFQLLQLEELYIQIKNKDQPISTIFPVALPWMSCKSRKPRNRTKKIAKFKQERQGWPNSDITTYAVAFALGLSLVGAGLLLGWTVGWMLPRL